MKFLNYLPFEKNGSFIWTNLHPLHPKMICGKFGWTWCSGCGEENFSNWSMYFPNFVIISPWKKEEPFICINLNPLHQKMICAKFSWNWPTGSWEKIFINLSMYFCYFIIFSPWKWWGPSYEQSLKDALCQVYLKLAQWFWRRRWKCEKFMTTRMTMITTTMGNGQILIRQAHLSLRLRCAKKHNSY